MKRLLTPTLLSLLCLLLPQPARASYQQCLQIYRAKQYRKAATCLRQIVKKLDALSTPTQAQRWTKGTVMRSAALALNKAAKATKDIEKAGYLRAQAIALLTRYDREKLFRSPESQKSTNRIRLQIQEALKLTPLTVVSGADKAKLSIQGYKFGANAIGKWSQSVRPGNYTITVVYPNEKSQTRRVTVAPGQAAIATFQSLRPKPVPSNTRRVIGWVLLGTGVAIAGFSALPFALFTDSNAKIAALGQESTRCQQNPASSGCDTIVSRIRQEGQNNTSLQIAAFATLGAGVAVAIVGVVLVALPAPAPQASAGLLTPPQDAFVLLP